MDETENKRIESEYKLLTDNIFFFPIIFDNPQLYNYEIRLVYKLGMVLISINKSVDIKFSAHDALME